MSAKIVYIDKEVRTIKKIPSHVDIELSMFQAQYIFSCLSFFGTQSQYDLVKLMELFEKLGFKYEQGSLVKFGDKVLRDNFEENIKNLLKRAFPNLED